MRSTAFPFVIVLVTVLVVGPALAAPPVVSPGECLYLVGAPPGAPAADVEEKVEGSYVETGCNLPHGVDLNRDGENMVQAWVTWDPLVSVSRAVCDLAGWVGHELALSSDVSVPHRAWLTLRGEYLGQMTLITSGGSANGLSARVFARVVESPRDERALTSEWSVLERQLVVEGPIEPEQAFAVRFETSLRPGRSYSVELGVEIGGTVFIETVDFGRPGEGRFVRYESIEVCVEPTPGAGCAIARDALERDLHDGRCMPGVWLPEASGGRLEEARSLVALRLAQAAGTGAPGVNERVAQRRLDEADARIADGDFQAACRSLSQGLRALTTP